MPVSADSHRFDQHSRLRTRRDFDGVFQGGRKLVNRQLVLWYRPAEGDRSRIGLSVSRRCGDAVRRNRIKRCLRVAFRALRDELDAPVDMVLIARPGQPPRDAASAEQALGHLLRRLRKEQRAAPAGAAPGAAPPDAAPAAAHDTAATEIPPTDTVATSPSAGGQAQPAHAPPSAPASAPGEADPPPANGADGAETPDTRR